MVLLQEALSMKILYTHEKIEMDRILLLIDHAISIAEGITGKYERKGILTDLDYIKKMLL